MDPHNPIIERKIMMDRLENYRAPRMSACILGLLLSTLALISVAVVWLDRPAAAPNIVQAPDSSAPLSHPFTCPIEDPRGRALQATLSIQGERRPRCYYGAKP